jgi:hypothetical protein
MSDAVLAGVDCEIPGNCSLSNREIYARKSTNGKYYSKGRRNIPRSRPVPRTNVPPEVTIRQGLVQVVGKRVGCHETVFCEQKVNKEKKLTLTFSSGGA